MASAPLTPLDALVAALINAADYDPRAEAPPEAVLWCDPGREFTPLIPLLHTKLDGLLVLDDYRPSACRGPAIWLRAAADRALPEVSWPDDRPAILYLPGVARETLRETEECPAPLALLAWFAVAGVLFGHPNGKDWTLRGFLASKPAYGGLGLDLPQDEATRTALAAAAPKLFGMEIERLRDRRLDASSIHEILAPDVVADTLDWIGGHLTEATDPARFTGFRERARAELNLDLGRVTPEVAARRLAEANGRWAEVWRRFALANPDFYTEVAGVLEKLDAPDLLADPRVWSAANARAEAELRSILLKLPDQSLAAARDTVLGLAAKHGPRHHGPWAARGRAPLAHAVVHLAMIAAAADLPGDSAPALAEAYSKDGWKADWAALAALAAAPGSEDREAVVAALRSIYGPWLEKGASALQKISMAAPISAEAGPPDADAVIFADGLRMDLAQQLAEKLRGAGATVEIRWRWSGFPTVTATCKPLASPVASRFSGDEEAKDFSPAASDGRSASKPVLERELLAAGWQPGLTLLAEQKCWLEAGHFDTDGHNMGVRLADQIEQGLDDLRGQILRLARGGRRVRVATDHGWLLLPGGLPAAKLDSGLTETKWARCAIVKDGAPTSIPQLQWSWNQTVMVASAPGMHAFRAGQDYAHGGISPQESIVADLIVAPIAAARRAVIVDLEWAGLRLRVRAEGGDGLTADLRLGAEGENGSVADRPRTLDADGRTSLLVPDDTLAGKPALLVLQDPEGKVVARRQTQIGG
ncbi:MAG: BREX-1 system phosphatase PglZ type B [Stellaceae bacterium]